MRHRILCLFIFSACTQGIVDTSVRTRSDGDFLGVFTCGQNGQICCSGSVGAPCMPGLGCIGGSCTAAVTGDGGTPQSMATCGTLGAACCALADGSQRCIGTSLSCDGATLTCVEGSTDEFGGDNFRGSGSSSGCPSDRCYDRTQKSCTGATRTASDGLACPGNSNVVCCTTGQITDRAFGSDATFDAQCSRRSGVCFERSAGDRIAPEESKLQPPVTPAPAPKSAALLAWSRCKAENPTIPTSSPDRTPANEPTPEASASTTPTPAREAT